MKIPLFLAPCLGAVLLLAACAAPKPVIDPYGATLDGMLPVRNSGLDEAWVRPDIDIGRYTQLMLLPPDLQYRSVRPLAGTILSRSTAREFPISPADRKQLLDTVTEIFRDELARSSKLTLTSQPGPDVLTVRIALHDIVSRVPPDIPGRGEIFLDTIGSATLVLQLEDSTSGQTLARGTDHGTADPIDGIGGSRSVSRVTPVTAWTEVRRLARRWAVVVTQRIDELHDLGRMPGTGRLPG